MDMVAVSKRIVREGLSNNVAFKPTPKISNKMNYVALLGKSIPIKKAEVRTCLEDQKHQGK